MKDTMKNLEIPFNEFIVKAEGILKNHPILVENKYLSWFEKGELTRQDVTHLLIQFSVLNNLLFVAQTKFMNNVVDYETFIEIKGFILNRLGVMGENPSSSHQKSLFEHLLVLGKQLGLEFNNLGKRKHASESTLYLTDQLEQLYDSDDFSVALGARYGFEVWASSKFWDSLSLGLKKFENKLGLDLSLGFLDFQESLKLEHKLKMEKLLNRLSSKFNPHFFFTPDQFYYGLKKSLDALEVFWNSLDHVRINRYHTKVPSKPKSTSEGMNVFFPL